MKHIIKLFTEHPNDVGESYFTHMIYALKIAGKCSLASYTQLIHAVFPFIPPVFQTDLDDLETFFNQMRPENRK